MKEKSMHKDKLSRVEKVLIMKLDHLIDSLNLQKEQYENKLQITARAIKEFSITIESAKDQLVVCNWFH